MPRVRFEPRCALAALDDPPPEVIRELLERARSFGSGEALIEFAERNARSQLLICVSNELGFYFKVLAGDRLWLSLGDAARLSEIVRPTDWDVSAGLFVDFGRAWLAIEAFMRTGGCSTAVHWIQPDALPDEAQW